MLAGTMGKWSSSEGTEGLDHDRDDFRTRRVGRSPRPARPDRSATPGSLRGPRRPGGLCRAGGPARGVCLGRLPPRARAGAGRRGRLPGGVPHPGAQGPCDLQAGVGGELAVWRRPPHGDEGSPCDRAAPGARAARRRRRAGTAPARAGRRPRTAAPPRRGSRPAGGKIPDAVRPVLPGGPDAPRGGPRTGLERRDRVQPAGAGPRPPAQAAGPPRLHVQCRAHGLRAGGGQGGGPAGARPGRRPGGRGRQRRRGVLPFGRHARGRHRTAL